MSEQNISTAVMARMNQVTVAKSAELGLQFGTDVLSIQVVVFDC